MKRPYYSAIDRLSMRLGTHQGDVLLLDLAFKKFIRDIKQLFTKMNEPVIVFNDLKVNVPEGYRRYECKLLAVNVHEGKLITFRVKIYHVTVVLPNYKVKIGYIPGAKCNCYKNKLSCEMPEETAELLGLVGLGLEELKYL
jgi:hypothetical protein